MGLDITAAAKAQFVTAKFDEKKHDNFGHHRIYAADGFADRLDGKPEGVYTFDGKPIRFGAGSYHAYSAWRKMLSLATLEVLPEVTWENFDAYKGKPFAELVCMSDCDGSIGPETSKKLASDFEAFKDTIEQKVRAVIVSHREFSGYDDTGIQWFMNLYTKWREAFKAASDDGLVIFH